MNEAPKLLVRRRTAARVKRMSDELAELRAVRERFQHERPALEEVLAAAGQAEATPLGEYLQTQGLLRALRQERERQHLTLHELAERTGYDPAVLSRLFTGRQANTTLATVGRIAHALGKEVIHTLRDLPDTACVPGPPNGTKAAPRGKVSAQTRAAVAAEPPAEKKEKVKQRGRGARRTQGS